MVCPNCGGEVPLHAARCAVCLAPLVSGAATVATVGFGTGAPGGMTTFVPGATIGTSAPEDPDETRDAAGGAAFTAAGLLREGSSFGPRYHIIRLLGVGGMGSVYQAWDKTLGVTVALKIINLPEGADAAAARRLEERFKRELLLARQVTHKSVVRIHDLGEIGGITYITMSYIGGSDLAAILKAHGPLPVARVLKIGGQVIDGLAAAHEAGVVHRDLKPANIMVDAEDQASIMDFGIALAATDGKLRTEGIVGTLAYMSPQQATGQPVDHRTDLYAFGLILYDMLGGRAIDRGADSAMADMLARIGTRLDPIRTINADVPEAVDSLIAKCVEPAVDARFQSARDIAAAFDRLDENGVPIPVPKARRASTIAVAAVLTVALSAGAWFIGRGSRRESVQHAPMSVLIADFDNRSGDPVFSGSLEQALGISVEGASFITSYRRDAAKRIAAQIKPGAPFDPNAARLVSIREGINVVLAGSIDQKGGGYGIAVSAVEPATGKTLSSVSATAASRAQVLPALGSVAAKIRKSLGDTAKPDAEGTSETFTASSLEAMNAYARAQELASATRNQEALAAYQQAVALDPEFGRAYAGMGVLYTVFKDEPKAKAAYEQALKYVGRMSEREKFRTLGTYYLSVARNYEKAIENYQMLVKKFPADGVGHGNLGLAYLNVGNLKGAVEEGRAALELSPRNSVQRYNFAMYSMYAGNLDAAAAAGQKILDETPSFELAYLPIALSKLAADDIPGALATYARLERTGPSGAALARFGRIDLEMYRGRLTDAAAIAATAIAADSADETAGPLAQDYVVSAEIALATGAVGKAVEAARRGAGLSDHESVLFPAARVLLQAGREDEAQKIADRLENMLQVHTTAYARLIRAEIAARRGRYGEAIELFRDSIKRRDTWTARFLLGRTYAEAEHFAEAMAELELCVNRRGEATDVFFYDTPSLRYLPPAYYWLARSQLALGVADAAKNYERYVALRAGAAPPDPLVADARHRLATLK